nr:hypothetical protein [Acidobacteriota bacterium]
ARQALGGDKKLAAITSFVATGQTRQVRGDNLIPIEFQINVQLPDRYSRRDETPAVESGYSTSGFNGDGLVQLPAPVAPSAAQMAAMARPGGPPPPTQEQLDAAQAMQRKARVVTLKQDFTRLTLGMFAGSFPNYPLTFTRIGIAESPQGKADIVEAKGPDNFTARLFISQDTHLPVMLTWTTPARAGATAMGAPAGARAGGAAAPPMQAPPAGGARVGGAAAPPTAPPAGVTPPAGGVAAPGAARPAPPAPPENRLYFADYREVDGMQLPFRLRRAVGADTTEETTFDRYKLNVKIDPKKFEVVK